MSCVLVQIRLPQVTGRLLSRASKLSWLVWNGVGVDWSLTGQITNGLVRQAEVYSRDQPYVNMSPRASRQKWFVWRVNLVPISAWAHYVGAWHLFQPTLMFRSYNWQRKGGGVGGGRGVEPKGILPCNCLPCHMTVTSLDYLSLTPVRADPLAMLCPLFRRRCRGCWWCCCSL